jgi:hypothetical protein
MIAKKLPTFHMSRPIDQNRSIDLSTDAGLMSHMATFPCSE